MDIGSPSLSYELGLGVQGFWGCGFSTLSPQKNRKNTHTHTHTCLEMNLRVAHAESESTRGTKLGRHACNNERAYTGHIWDVPYTTMCIDCMGTLQEIQVD